MGSTLPPAPTLATNIASNRTLYIVLAGIAALWFAGVAGLVVRERRRARRAAADASAKNQPLSPPSPL